MTSPCTADAHRKTRQYQTGRVEMRATKVLRKALRPLTTNIEFCFESAFDGASGQDSPPTVNLR
jgi:hypothetical protein